jgi:hypothetical protein
VNPVSRIHELVRTRRITPAQAADLLERRREFAAARWRYSGLAIGALWVAVLAIAALCGD